jgi:hypothetical protein
VRALIAAVAALCLVPASAGAYAVGGHPWPSARITYYVAAKAYTQPVNRAARIWNQEDVGVTFARARRTEADVIVSYGGPRCAGASPVGFGGFYEMTVMRLGAGCATSFIMLTAVHEFGHVLGLDHENTKCARMNWTFSTSGTPIRCRKAHSLGYWLRHPLEPDDLRGARALYDGRH